LKTIVQFRRSLNLEPHHDFEKLGNPTPSPSGASEEGSKSVFR
jgi:hypothetical protein